MCRFTPSEQESTIEYVASDASWGRYGVKQTDYREGLTHGSAWVGYAKYFVVPWKLPERGLKMHRILGVEKDLSL